MTNAGELKNKGGRPKGSTKAKKGAMLWIPAEIIDTVQSMVQVVNKTNRKCCDDMKH
jgi:hypothetical protein